MDQTPKLSLPYLMPSQTQKHVTLNETFRQLDILVQACVHSRSEISPPVAPSEGDGYLLSAEPTGGAWTGAASGTLTWFQDGAWRFLLPQEGWRVFINDEAVLSVFDGTGWRDIAGEAALNATSLGINSAASAQQRLSVKSDFTLISHDDVTPGSGDAYIQVNKAGPDRTASLLFQSGWSGRAEIGLAGDDRLALKTSGDGSQWHTAMLAGANGYVAFNGAAPQPDVPLYVIDERTGYKVAMKVENPGDPGSGATRLEVSNAASGFLLQAYGSTAPGSLSSSGAIIANKGSGGLVIGAKFGGVQLIADDSFLAPQFTITSDRVETQVPLSLAAFTTATLPVGADAGSLVFLADEGALAFFNGSEWRRLGDQSLA
jgi:hypothetical protein